MSTASRVTKTARELIRVRLRARGKVSRSDKDQLDAPQGDKVSAGGLIQELAQLVGIDADYFRPDDQLGELLRVRRPELPTHMHPLVDNVGLHDAIDPFALALLHLVERRIGGNKRLLKGAAFQPPPRDEDEWVERINAMTVRELSSALTS